MIGNFVRDLRHAVRGLGRAPAFTATVVLILGLGIGMATAVFTVFESVLLRPLPVRDQDRLVQIVGDGPGTLPRFPLTYRAYKDLRADSRALEETAGFNFIGAWPLLLRDRDALVSLRVTNVTGNFFRTLGMTPVLGRLPGPEDAVVGAPYVLAIGEEAWRRYFGGDPGVIGRHLALAGTAQSFEVVGIVPAGLEYPAGTEAWSVQVPAAAPADTIDWYVDVVARLAPGATPALARTEFLDALHGMEWSNPEILRQLGATVTPLADVITGDVRPALLAVSAAVSLLLLITCTNAGNLLLLRASGRSQEIAVRRVLGADVVQLVRQLLAESLVLAAAGGVLGLLLARALLQLLVHLAPADLPRLDALDAASVPVAVAAAITLGSTLLFGLAPALWAARRDLGSPLRAGARGGGPGRRARFVRRTLVAWQVALALIVLAGAGLVARSLARLQRLDIGYDAEHVTIVQFAWPWERFGTPEKARSLVERILARVEAMSGVSAATPIARMPFAGAQGFDGSFLFEGQDVGQASVNPWINMEAAGPDYFRTFGLPLLAGRSFTAEDRDGAPKVAVVSEAVARRHWPGQDPIGRRLRFNAEAARGDWYTVVGVVPDTRYRSYRESAPTIYFSFRQWSTYVIRMAIRTSGAATTSAALDAALAEIEPDLDVWTMDPMDRLLDAPLARPRLDALLLSAFGLAALALAAIGIYGVMASETRQRMRELGVRAALGATPARLRRLVLGQALMVVGAGAIGGLAVALATSRLLVSMLFEVSPTDPAALAAAVVLLLAVALFAAWLPARRAMRTDPVEALRAEDG